MPRILAIDTTHEFGSIALLRGEEVLEEVPLHAPNGFGHILYEAMAQMLERCGVDVSEIDCFASAAGPGSFTGVRIGLTAVKGLAEALQRPAVAVSNLQAMASFGEAQLRAPLLDARRGEIYGAVYDGEGVAVQPEVVMRLPDWLRTLPAGVEFLATEPAPFRSVLPAVTQCPRALAAAIGRIGAQRLARGNAGSPAALDANYVRRSDAEILNP